MRKIIIALGLFAACTVANAQQKVKFSSQTYTGILAGEVNAELQLQLINGVKWKKWFGGVGAGIDWYYTRSVPVFASVNRDIFKKGRNTLLLTGDIGINIPWAEPYNYLSDFTYSGEFKRGLYWASGVGYKFGVGKSENALTMNFGYSFKQTSQEIINNYPCLSPPCNPVIEKYDYKLNRLSIRLGWIF